MGIVSLSLLALAIVGTIHLFNIVSWVERLQDRLIKILVMLIIILCHINILQKVSSTWRGAAWRPPRRKSLSRCQEGSFWAQFLLKKTTTRCQEWSRSRLWGSFRSAEALWREWRPRRWPTSSSWSSSSQAHRSRLHRHFVKKKLFMGQCLWLPALQRYNKLSSII